MRHLRLPTAASILLLSCALGTVGCAIEGEPPGELDEIAYGDSSCPDTGCGTNGSFVKGWSIGELHEGLPFVVPGAMPYTSNFEQSGETNSAGVRLLHLRKNNQFYRADVEGHRLVGRNAMGDVILHGEGLRDSALVVELPDGEVAYAHIVEMRHGLLPFWVKPDANPAIEAFRLRWSESPVYQPTGPAQDVCPPATEEDADDPDSYFAVFYRGNRYDEATKLVIATGDQAGPWFNVACFKSVSSKMLFNRHAVAGAKAGYEATPDQSQAFLKMLTADFCGWGQSFTEPGTALDWTNSLGWQSLPKSADHLEAVWGPDGALCLDDARLGNETEIGETCTLPACEKIVGRFPRDWKEAGYLLSAHP